MDDKQVLLIFLMDKPVNFYWLLKAKAPQKRGFILIIELKD